MLTDDTGLRLWIDCSRTSTTRGRSWHLGRLAGLRECQIWQGIRFVEAKGPDPLNLPHGAQWNSGQVQRFVSIYLQ